MAKSVRPATKTARPAQRSQPAQVPMQQPQQMPPMKKGGKVKKGM